MVAGARELSAMAGGVEAKAGKITQANTITQPLQADGGVALEKGHANAAGGLSREARQRDRGECGGE